MHVDNVAIGTNGVMTINLTELLNPTQAATFVGSTFAGSATVDAAGAGYLTIQVTLTPGAPLVEPVSSADPGGSATIDG